MEISFQRAIIVYSNTNSAPIKEKTDGATLAVLNTMKGENSSVYDKETSRKIGSFLRAQIGDYNNKTGMYIRRVNGRVCLFTGEEVKKARQIVEDAKKEAKELDERYSAGADSSMPLSEQVALQSEKLHKILRQNVFLERDRKLLAMTEHGFYNPKGKNDTQLFLSMGDDNKLRKIEYLNCNYSGQKHVKKEAVLTIWFLLYNIHI